MDKRWEGLGEDSEESLLDEAKRAWELQKKLGMSSSWDEIDMIWAIAKNRNNRDGKRKQSSTGKKRGRKAGKMKT